MELIKKCLNCNTEKPFVDFHKQAASKDGYTTVCKECRKDKLLLDPIKHFEQTERAKKYYKDNKTERDAYKKEYKKRHIPKTLLSRKNALRDVLSRDNDYFSPTVNCTSNELKRHIESQFEEGMEWINRNLLWYVGFIKNPKEFNVNDSDDLKKAYYYNNLKPVWKRAFVLSKNK